MAVKVRWSEEAKEPTIEGMKYNSDYEGWMHDNFSSNRAMRDAVREWEKKTHKSLDDLYYEMQSLHMADLRKEAKEIDRDEAVDIIRDGIPENVSRGWFVNGDSDYKPRLFGYIMDKKGLLNAGWNIAYDHYKHLMSREGKTPLSFKKWLYTPQTYYRGDTGTKLHKNDRFVAFTSGRNVAEKFANGREISEIRIRPIDTLGAYQTTGESEISIPRWKLKS